MPVQYGSIIEEHRAVRTTAGLFDLSHMGELYVEGPEAGAGPRRGPRIGPAQPRGRPGALLDDVRARRRDHRRPDRVPARRRAVPRRGQRRQRGGRVRRPGRAARPGSGRSSTTGRWRPASSPSRVRASAGLLAPLTDVDLGALRYYAIAEGTVAGIPGLVARTGYTGEDGFEVFVDTARTGELWDALLDAVARRRMALPVGLGARDTLRLEAGMPLYGNELDLDDEPVRGRPRPGGQARQDRRLRRPGGAREGRPGRSARDGWSA